MRCGAWTYLTIVCGAAACSSSHPAGAADGSTANPTIDSGFVTRADARVTATPDASPPAAPDAMGPTDRVVTCSDPPPPGSVLPPPLPAYSGGTCPAIAIGYNHIASGGADREFLVVAPADYDPATETLPVVFMWHYLGGDANAMLEQGEVQAAADMLRFIAVIPNKKGDLPIPFTSSKDWCWPYLTTVPAARVEEEATFFDDMLACVAATYPINESCVSSVGVSAGALWTSQLAQLRADRLSSVLIISGGIGPASPVSLVDAMGWTGASRPMPAMIVWGGAMDHCVLNFDMASRNIIAALVGEGHFVEECIHNCGHAVPPMDDPTAGLASLYRFTIDHPYWLRPGESPYHVTGLPAGTPSWCGIGPDSATERTGMCTSTSADSGCPPGI